MPRGRRKTRAATVTASVEAVSAAPKKRGRPKGSKNKPKVAAASPPAKRGPGRPKGSATKAKAAAVTPPAATAKRGPGRPKGSATRKRRTRKVAARRAGRPGAAAVAAQALGGRIDALISQLEALKAEVGKLERVRAALRSLPKL